MEDHHSRLPASLRLGAGVLRTLDRTHVPSPRRRVSPGAAGTLLTHGLERNHVGLCQYFDRAAKQHLWPSSNQHHLRLWGDPHQHLAGSGE